MFTSIIPQFILLVLISALGLLINQTNLYNLIPEELTFTHLNADSIRKALCKSILKAVTYSMNANREQNKSNCIAKSF